MQPLTGFPIHGLHSLAQFLGEVNLRLLRLRSSGPSDKTSGEKDLALSAKFKKGKRPKSKKPQKDGNLSHIRCFRCDQLGHYAKDCKKFPPQRKQSGKSKRKRFQASIAIEEKVEEGKPQKRVMRSATREEKNECFL